MKKYRVTLTTEDEDKDKSTMMTLDIIGGDALSFTTKKIGADLIQLDGHAVLQFRDGYVELEEIDPLREPKVNLTTDDFDDGDSVMVTSAVGEKPFWGTVVEYKKNAPPGCVWVKSKKGLRAIHVSWLTRHTRKAVVRKR